MSAAKYSLTLTGVNKISPAFQGAAADADDFTGRLREQQKEVRQLTHAQRDLGKYIDMKRGLASAKQGLQEVQVKTAGLATELNAAKGSVKRLSDEHRSAARTVDKLAASISAAGAPTAEIQAQFKQAQARAEALGAELDQERGRVKQLSSSFDSAKGKAANLKAEFKEQQAALNGLGGQLRSAGVNTGDLAGEQARLRRATDAANKGLATQKDRLAELNQARSRVGAADARMAEAQGDIAGTAAALATVAVPLVRSVTMEAAMADVAKVTDFQGDEQAEFQSGLQRLAVDVNMLPEQLTAIAAAAGQSGVAKGELAGFTESAAKMGVAFDMAAADAGETMAAWRAGMGLNQQQAVQLADAVNHVSNNMNAKARDISGVLQRQGAVATASGLQADQAASLAGALLSGGASEEVAATTMKNLLGALTKGDAATSSQQAALGALGLDATVLASGMQQDAVGTLREVFDALAAAPVEQQSALISQLFGEESKGGIMPLLKNTVLLQQAFTLTADSAAYLGSAQDEFNSRAGTSEHRLGAAVRSFDRLLLVLGNSLLPIVGPVADGAAWIANQLADLAEAGGWVTSTLTGLAAAYAGYKVASLGWRLAQAKLDQLRSKSALRQATLAARTGDTATRAGLAARALTRLNRALARTGAMRGGGAAGYYGDGSDTGSRRSRRRRAGRRGGKFGRLASLAGRGWDAVSSFGGTRGGKAAKWGLGAAAMAVPSMVNAGELASTASDVVGGLSDLAGSVGGKLGSLAGKALKPLDLVLQGSKLVGAVASGDATEIGGTAGDMLGGMGGMWAGGAAGAAIGSVVPLVGTAIGGAIGATIGGIAGSDLGGWLGEKVGGLFGSDDKPAPVESALQQAKREAQTAKPEVSDNRQITFSPNITVYPAPDMDVKQLADTVMQTLREQFMPLLDSSLPGRLDDSMEITS